MLIWRGFGWVALAVAVVINVAINEALISWLGIPVGFEHYRDAHPGVWLMGFGLAGAACWFTGTWLEARALASAQVLQDKTTGQDVHLIARHDLFWIPVKWWALVWPLMGLFMLYPHEKNVLVYPRGLWREFEAAHLSTGSNSVAYQGDRVLLVNGKVSALEGDALAMGVDDGKTADPVFVPNGPRLLLYPLASKDAGASNPAPIATEWNAYPGKIQTFRCKAAESVKDAQGAMRVITLLGCRANE